MAASTAVLARPSPLEHEEAVEMDVGNLLMKASDNISVRRAFGTAYEKDDMLIIPVAMVAGGGGGGEGRPRHGPPITAGTELPPEPNGAGHEAPPKNSGPLDAGGGFGGMVVPTGAYVVKGGEVRWVPAVDVTIVVLASLALVRVLARAWTRGRRSTARR